MLHPIIPFVFQPVKERASLGNSRQVCLNGIAEVFQRGADVIDVRPVDNQEAVVALLVGMDAQPIVDDMAFQQIFFQYLVCPTPELYASTGFNPIADRQNHVQIYSIPLGTLCRRRQLSQISCHKTLAQLHVALIEPYCLVLILSAS